MSDWRDRPPRPKTDEEIAAASPENILGGAVQTLGSAAKQAAAWNQVARYLGQGGGQNILDVAAQAAPAFLPGGAAIGPALAMGVRSGMPESPTPAKDSPLPIPGIPGLADMMRAAGGSGGGVGGTSSTSTRLGRSQDVEYLKGEHAAGAQLAGQEARLAEQQTRVNTWHDQTIRDWAQQAKDAHSRLGEAGKEVAAEYRSVVSELKAARDQLKTMKVDPTRMWDSMPTTQKVMMAIGSLAGGFAEGVSGGKLQNDVGRWWEQAVNRDIEQQRDAIKAKMQEVELTQKDRDSIWQKWQQAEDQIRTAAGRASQLELSRCALATDDVKMKGQLAKSIADIGARVRAAEHGEFVASQSITTKGYSSAGGGAKAGGITPEKMKEMLYQEQAVIEAQKIKAIIAKHGGTRPVMGSDASELKQAQERMLYLRAKASGAKGRELSTEMKVGEQLTPERGLLKRGYQWLTGSRTPEVDAASLVKQADETIAGGKLAAASLLVPTAKKK